MFKPKMIVEIVYENLDSYIVKKPIVENKIIIKKGKKGYEGKAWEPKFHNGCVMTRRYKILGLFWRSIKKVMVKEGSEHCVDWTADPDPELHGITRDDMLELARLDSIRRSGAIKIKHELPIVFWILVLTSIVSLGLQVMHLSGIRFV